jgi:radical SAM protein with 4Fe4S-binding SPASM domain
VESCRLSPEDNVKLSLQRSVDLLREKIGDGFDERNIRVHSKNLRKCTDCGSYMDKNYYLSLFGCSGGMSAFAVTWDGKLQACQVLGAFYTDVKKLGLKKAWETFPLAVNLPPVSEKCLNCEKNEICQSCYALRYAETGDVSGCPEYACADSEVMNSYIV